MIKELLSLAAQVLVSFLVIVLIAWWAHSAINNKAAYSVDLNKPNVSKIEAHSAAFHFQRQK